MTICGMVLYRVYLVIPLRGTSWMITRKDIKLAFGLGSFVVVVVQCLNSFRQPVVRVEGTIRLVTENRENSKPSWSTYEFIGDSGKFEYPGMVGGSAEVGKNSISNIEVFGEESWTYDRAQ